MTKENIFQQASRKKLRFVSTVMGFLSTEDLWDLSLTTLDGIAKAVNKEIKESQEGSFLSENKKPSDSILDLQLEILKSVIDVKETEAAVRKAAADRQAYRQKLIDALANAESNELASQSPEELRKRLQELEQAPE